MAKIKVHVLNFHSIFSHIELVLENTETNPRKYYAINRWEEPAYAWSASGPSAYIQAASSKYSFDIEADHNEIVEEWGDYWYETYENASILGENCAVAAQRFLTYFANIPEPSSSNVSWNHLALGIMWPSFIPCPVTLPGRIMSNVKFHTRGAMDRFASIADLPDDHSNIDKKEAIRVLKGLNGEHSPYSRIALKKFDILSEFYDSLSDIRSEANLLRKNGHSSAADCADKLANDLLKNSTDYLKSQEDGAYIVFKNKSLSSIKSVRPKLEVYPGWKRLLGNLTLAVLSAGVFYVIAACINRKLTGGRYTFFSSSAANKTYHLSNQLGDGLDKKQAAINASSFIKTQLR